MFSGVGVTLIYQWLVLTHAYSIHSQAYEQPGNIKDRFPTGSP